MNDTFSTTAADRKVDGRAILLHQKDDVATALRPLDAGEEVTATLGSRSVSVVLQESIEFGHKFSLRTIEQGEDVLKYGLPIGRALVRIDTGKWIHVHNCQSERFTDHHKEVIDDRDLTTGGLMGERI